MGATTWGRCAYNCSCGDSMLGIRRSSNIPKPVGLPCHSNSSTFALTQKLLKLFWTFVAVQACGSPPQPPVMSSLESADPSWVSLEWPSEGQPSPVSGSINEQVRLRVSGSCVRLQSGMRVAHA